MWRTAELLRRTAYACLALSAVALAACGSSGTSGGGGDGGQTDATGQRDVSTVRDAGKDARDSGNGGNKDSGHGDAHSSKGDASPDAVVLGEGGAGDSGHGDAAVCPDGGLGDAAIALDCTGKCGPVVDTCTGIVVECGGCSPIPGVDGGAAQPAVCNLATNTCAPVKTTCAELGAQCGTVVDSCGQFLDCPDGPTKGCPAGQQCDTDSNQCVICQPVSCLDLGFQCGLAWLGCGPDVSSNYTDCGSCSGTDVCNSVFNICEHDCVPGTAAALCMAAGAQCGIITNGCGGTVDCDSVSGLGCPVGQGCGVVGIANQCDPTVTPVECAAEGRNCGSIVSACGGEMISCGQCPTGDVCNSNGVCGPPCEPKTCANFSDIECGTFPDGCQGTVSCGMCPGGVCNQMTHNCCTQKTCNGDYPDQCGNGLSDGCTGTIDCTCPTGDTCMQTGGAGTPGTCCTATMTVTSYTAAGQCGSDLPNGCGSDNVNVTCPNGGECVGTAGKAPASGVVGTCCAPPTCSGVATGSCESIADTCITGNKISCNKCVSPKTCVNGDECCTPAPACPTNVCNTSTTSPDCGSPRQCNCAAGNDCLCGGVACGTGVAGTCTPILTCAHYPNQCGVLSNGVGGTINCGCPNGEVCNAGGTCQCNTPNGMAYTCANVPGGPGTAGGAACGSFNNGCGGSVNCNCPAGQDCNSSVNPAVCCNPTACPAPGVGSACGNVSNGCGGNNNCGCANGEVCDSQNSKCCAPTSCPANPGVGTACGKISNGCGSNNNCGCGGGEVCDSQTNLCCAPTSCPANPGVGSACGMVSNSCGGNNQCSCPSGTGNENFQCTGGTCECTPDTCMGRVGPFPNGCGGTIMCSG